VLGFPSDEFFGQELATNKEIAEFVANIGVTFPIMDKVKVNGNDAHPLFIYLRTAVPGIFNTTAIKWNFTKFLIDRNGQPLKRYSTSTNTEELENDILALLK